MPTQAVGAYAQDALKTDHWPVHEAQMGVWGADMGRKSDDQIWSGKRIAIELLVMAMIGLVFGFLGPFGTFAIPVGIRLAYWVLLILVGYIVFRPISVCAGWLAEVIDISEWFAGIIASAVAALPLTFFVGFTIWGMPLDPNFFGQRFVILYLQCAMVGFGIFALMRLVFGDRDTAGPAPEKPELVFAPETGNEKPLPLIEVALHKRLPVGFPCNIFALSVEDHYVRVHAPDQSEMILLRLSDAIAEISELEGMQVHRGWWVARDAIKTAKRDGRNLKLILSNGLEIPVSRSYVGKLKQTGWI
ncbi:LytTR family transcriptional regulator [Parasphingorhabdus halotolerans]|uniref:LytTR family transcriptional regulator n=1 Tax=Parasphingorhabdus halotolerans TaxID=2725558 RepID=A0A6H2DM19_9SPHN|nr:LytTR family transcriptional regulator [Parasphingorhabdus halotolerans]